MGASYRPEIIQGAFINFLGSRLQPFWSLTTPRVRLIARQALNDELFALQFETNQAFKRQAFAKNDDWQGGQYISLTTPLNGIYHQRNYSIVGLAQQPLALQKSMFAQTSLDDNKGLNDKKLLTIAIKPQGLVSDYLTERAKLGEVFDAGIPNGDFTLEQMTLNRPSQILQSQANKLTQNTLEQSALASLLFIAGGSGITPMLGLITQALEQGYLVTLLYYQRGSKSATPFVSYWQYLADNYKTFNYHIVSTIEPKSYLANSKYLTVDSLLALQLPLANTTIFACGSASLLQGLYQAASDIELPNNASLLDNIIIENFGTATSNFTQSEVVNSQDLKPQTVILRSRQQRFTTETTLLLGAEKAGIRLPYGCRQGICQLCRCQKISGMVKNMQTGKLSSNSFESIQTCINVAMSEVVLEI